MCITSEDIRSQEEAMIWDTLCNECVVKAEKLLDERKAFRLFDMHIEEYGFCQKCTGDINAAFEKDAKLEFGEEIP
jgi:hypothetical protein